MIGANTIRRRTYLRCLRWRIRLRHVPALPKSFAIAIILSLCVIPIWRHFGTDIALPILADATPILLAIVGVVMSYIQPKKESHRATTVILIIAGLLGTAILSANRLRGEAGHRKEVTDLGHKMDIVRDQNATLSNFLLSAKNSGNLKEADRRHGIETTLRNEYILSHNPIDPGILAGTKMPPQEWMNQKLHELGENWTVSKEVSQKLAEPRSYVIMDGNPKFTGPNASNSEGSDFVPGSPVVFNFYYKNTGPNAVQLLDEAGAAYIQDGNKPETQDLVVNQFTSEYKKEKKSLKERQTKFSHVHTMGAGTQEFFSAAERDNGMPRIFTQEDLDNLKNGSETAYVITQIDYKDGGVTHHLRTCIWLQPPATAPGTWHFCDVFNDSN